YHWLPESVRIFGITTLFVGILFFATWSIRSALPDDVKKLELLTRIQYKFNEKVDTYLEVNKSREERGFLANLVNDEFSPLIADINNYLTLNPGQTKTFIEYYESKLIDEKYYQYFLKNIDHKELEQRRE